MDKLDHDRDGKITKDEVTALIENLLGHRIKEAKEAHKNFTEMMDEAEEEFEKWYKEEKENIDK